MKTTTKYISLLIFLFISLGDRLDAQSLIIKDGADTYTQQDLLTGKAFILDLTLPQNVSGCMDVDITFSYPAELQFISVIMSSEYEVISQTATSVTISNLVPLSSAQNIQLNYKVRGDGTVCENIAHNISSSLQFNDDQGAICGTVMNSNEVSIKPKYNQSHGVSALIMNTNDVCIGGYTRYKLEVPALNRIGGYNLENSNLSVSIDGTIVSVTKFNGSPVNYNLLNAIGCSKEIKIPIGDIQVGRSTRYFVTVLNDCACYGASGIQNIDLECSLVGVDPCNITKTTTDNLTHAEDSNCCGSGVPLTISYNKGILGGFDMCAGGCTDYAYFFNFTNGQNPLPVDGYIVSDNISNEIVVTGIYTNSFPNPTGGNLSYQFCFEHSLSSGIETCKTVGVDIAVNSKVTISDAPASNMNINIPSNSNITNIKWKYIDPIPAWYIYNISNQLFFRIKDNVSSLSDNIAIFSANSPTFQESYTHQHRPLSSCNSDYKINANIINPLLSSSFNSNTTQGFPLDIVRIQYKLWNFGETSNPLPTLNIELPPQLSYIGNPTYGTTTDPFFTGSVSNPLPSSISFSNNSVTNEVIFDNIEIQPYCDNTIDYILIEFDVKINPYTLSQALNVRANITGGGSSSCVVFVNEKFILNGSVYKQCADGSLFDDAVQLGNGEAANLVYEIENVGNITASNLKILSTPPRLGDLSLHNGITRNSQYDINYNSIPQPLNTEVFDIYSSTNYDAINLCQQFTSTFSPQNEYHQIVSDPSYILNPGDKFSIKYPIDIQGNPSTNEIAFSDFVFCAVRRDIMQEIPPSPSNMLQLSYSNNPSCNEVVDCEEESIFTNRIQGAFDFQINGMGLVITSSYLMDNDSWYPIWDDNTYGGNNYQSGNSKYSHTYSEPGTYEVCITINNHQVSNDPDSQRCHCDVFCQTITITAE